MKGINCNKRLLISLIAIITMISSSFCAFAQRGEKSLGIMGGYNTHAKSAVAGIFFQYRFNSWLRIAPDIEYIIQHNNVSSYTFNVDMHFPLLGNQRANVYPLAGVSYQSWRLKNNGNNENFTNNNLGIDAGAGFELKITPTLKFFMQGKYTFIKQNPSTNLVLGLGYAF